MTLYGTALFLHVVGGIALVGGGLYTHVSLRLAARGGDVRAVEAHAAWVQVFVRGSGPLALTVLATGIGMAFGGRWWGAGWPAVSLGLFAMGGAIAMGRIDPQVRRLRAALEQRAGATLDARSAATLVGPSLRAAGWLLVGADLAIVFLMTNKPGWTGSLVAAGVGIAAGLAAGTVANRASRRDASKVPAASAGSSTAAAG